MSHHDRSPADDESPADSQLAESPFQTLRVWPLIVLGVVFFLTLLVRLLESGSIFVQIVTVAGPALSGVLIILWWLTCSRANWRERLFGTIGIVAAFAVTFVLLDKTMKGGPTLVITFPMGTAAFGIGAFACRRVLSMKRTVVAVLMATIGFGTSTLLRGEGMWGNAAIGLDWRFRPSAEERLVAAKEAKSELPDEASGLSAFDPAQVDDWLAAPEWPAFRGSDRSGNVSDTTLATNWTSEPPRELWKVPIGPAWSSFAVAGQLLFTQEQRGKIETVVCYAAETGQELWQRGIESRFEESLGGPGPRATPTIADGSLFVMGASGQLMRIDAKTGNIQWQTDLREVAQRKPPTWGFSSSPLVVDSLVIVHAGGSDELGTIAFDMASGNMVWSVAAGSDSYASPQICKVGGDEFVTILTNNGADFIDASSGEIKLAYRWKIGGYRCLQPRVVGENLVLIPSDATTGTQLIRLAYDEDTLTAEAVWTSRNMKPDFNDLVTFEGHAYGFDGTIFACVDLETGERNWKRGRYGKGQVLLIRDAGLLLVASERGQLILLKADPTAHEEIASIDAIAGKTWNHPVLVGDRLYIRNATEAACFQLPTVAAAAE